MQSYNHFTLEERENLRILLMQGMKIREIARYLERNASSVSREIARNAGRRGYNAWAATSQYLYRRKRCKRTYRLENDPELLTFVKECLKKYWSPEIIVAKWKIAKPQSKLSHATIYRAIEEKRLPAYPANLHLRRRGRLKYKRGGVARPYDHTVS